MFRVMSASLFTVFSTKKFELKYMLAIHSNTSQPIDNMKNHFQVNLVERASIYQIRKCTGLNAVKRPIFVINPSGRN